MFVLSLCIPHPLFICSSPLQGERKNRLLLTRESSPPGRQSRDRASELPGTSGEKPCDGSDLFKVTQRQILSPGSHAGLFYKNDKDLTQDRPGNQHTSRRKHGASCTRREGQQMFDESMSDYMIENGQLFFFKFMSFYFIFHYLYIMTSCIIKNIFHNT